jgi:hypothetical protein
MEELNINLEKYDDKSKIIILILILTEIRKEFDISIKILQEIINNKYFIKLINFINININKTYINNLSPLIDHCGYLHKICNNEYYKFCNVHKYIHDENITDHQFEQFSIENKIIFHSQEEKINNYKNTVQIIYNKIYYIIKKLLLKNSTIINIDLKNISEWHKANTNHFRNKNNNNCFIWNNFKEDTNIIKVI